MEGEPVTIEAPVTDAGADATEAASDAAVEIAQINADRDVSIAETNAETAVELAEIADENEVDELEWFNSLIGALEATLVSRLDALATRQEQMLELAQQNNTMLTALLIQIAPSSAETAEAETATEAESLEPETEAASGDGAADHPEVEGRRVRPKRLL